jgi:hypothetical protein
MLINDASITGSLIVNASASFQNISVGGNIIPDETNIRNLGSTDKYFKEIYVSTGSINFVDETGVVGTLNAGTITAIQSNTSSANSRLDSVESVSASLQSFTASISATNTFTSSATARLNALETTSASVDTLNTNQNNRLGSLETISASNISRISALETTSASVDTLNTTQNTRLTNLEIKTGSLATTGSNTFIGTQTITGSLFISANLVVQGTSSLENITASAVSIGTNIVNLNTANPAIRYAGLVIGDSGSVGGSGSFLYDSVQDEMIFVHRGANTTVTSSVTLMGPQTFDNVGNETYPTCNRIQKGTGNEHLVDSCITDSGTLVTINSATQINSSITGCGAISTSGTGLNASLRINNTTSSTGKDWHLYSLNNGNFGLYNNTDVSYAYQITPSGNMSIATTSVSNTYGTLTIAGTGLSIADDGNAKLQIGRYSSTACNAYIKMGANACSLRFTNNTDLADVMIIEKGGNVGVGTSSPSDFIDAGLGLAIINTSGRSALALGSTQGTANEVLGRVSFTNTNSTNIGSKRLAYVSGVRGTTDNSAYLEFGTADNALGTQRMVISQTGNVGINTTNFGERLNIGCGGAIAWQNTCNCQKWHIQYNSADGLNFVESAVADFRLFLKAGGSVGIGTSNPTAPLTIRCDSSSGASFMEIATCASNAYRYVSINPGTGISYCIPGGTSQSPVIEVQGGEPSVGGGSLRIRTGAMGSASDRMIITQGGHITRPFQPFVMGGIASDQSISTSNPTKINFVANTGHFGCNVSGCWNNSTYSFSAPVTGVYLVNISGYWSHTNLINQFAAYVNGNRKVSIPTAYCTNIAGGSMMVPLGAGEVLDFRVFNDVTSGTLYSNIYHTFFSLYLL